MLPAVLRGPGPSSRTFTSGWSLAGGRVYVTVELPGRTRSRPVLNVSCLGTSTAAAPVAVGAAVGMEVCWLPRSDAGWCAVHPGCTAGWGGQLIKSCPDVYVTYVGSQAYSPYHFFPEKSNTGPLLARGLTNTTIIVESR